MVLTPTIPVQLGAPLLIEGAVVGVTRVVPAAPAATRNLCATLLMSLCTVKTPDAGLLVRYPQSGVVKTGRRIEEIARDSRRFLDH